VSRRRRRALLALGLVVAVVVGYRALAPTPAPESTFAAWRLAHRDDLAAYLAFLRVRGVAGIVPPEQLLRLGRRWRACGNEAWALPPRERWPAIVPTLSLLRELRAAGLARDWDVVSAYRPAAFNRCEGGSPGSRHLDNAAIDLQARGKPDVRALCSAWRRLGPARRWGLGFYAADRIHLDTMGFRTWGYSYHADSSLCGGNPAAAGADRLESTRLPTPEPS
jgi:hypothetical protein